MKQLYIIIFSLVIGMFLPMVSFSQQIQSLDKVYIKVEIKGLACPFCAYGMERKLKKVSGVKNVDIKLKKGMAYIVTTPEQKPEEQTLKDVILEAGFTPGEILYSHKPLDNS